ncbi:MAG: HAMP domain-containing sensor histidine kinase, partial [Burkholderiaceae bacterium]
ATLLLQEIAEGLQPLAQERHLYLRFDGPATCAVQGDEIKVRRIVQNLVLNAVKYTRQGGVAVSWGSSAEGDEERWFIQVQDTGPGFHAGPGSRIVHALEVATDRSDELATDAESGDVTHASREQSRLDAPSNDARSVHQQPGEGLGLSIVKRLCELLDATMEMESKTDVGTTIRILLPRRYGTD